MAAHIHGSCIKCGKQGGILVCNGCHQTLCFKHVNEHKNELDKQLEDLILEENHFENDLSTKDDSNELFVQIDQWRKDSIEQIKQIAKQTKEDLRVMIIQSNEQLLKFCQPLKENIRLLKESEDFSEIQLIQLTNEFNHLKNQIHSFHLIKSFNTNYLRIEKQSIYDIVSPPSPLPPPPIEKPLFHIEQIHSNQHGSVLISTIDPYGYFIVIEHNGERDQDMVGWILKRSIDSYLDLIYRFPNDFILKSKSSIRILSKQASQTLYSYDKANCLIADFIPTWGTAIKTTCNTLLDANGDQRDVFTQIFK